MPTAAWPEQKLTRPDDDLRMERRASIRKRIGEGEILMQRVAGLDRELQRLDDVVAEAADVHSSVCLPLQEELSSLEGRAVQRIADRQTADAAEDARRVEIVDEINRQNSILEAVRHDVDQQKLPLLQERRRVSVEAAGMLADASLSHPSVVNPRLADLQHAANNRREWAGARLADAVRRLEAAKSSDKLSGTSRTSRWEAVVADCRSAVDEADEALASIHQAIIQE